jgi:lactobin A/cerein 7B family class IIb bacteriocin
MQDIQYARELSDQELENVVGGVGTGHSALAGASASANASAYATGGFFHINEGFAETEVFTIVNRKGISASLAFGIAVAVAL